MVNYEFVEIDAFHFFKKKIINNIKINGIYLNWFINIKKRFGANWKENHSKGGGIIFNYVCHAIYYLEFLFGKITSIQTNIFLKEKSKIKTLEGVVFFDNGLSAQLNIKVGPIKKKFNPIHQLKILSDKKTYILKTNLNSLSDKFKLITFGKNPNKSNKILFKGEKNQDDFRIKPTLENSKKFATWILKGKTQAPDFFDAQRVHLIINKMMISSKKKRRIKVEETRKMQIEKVKKQ